MPWVDLVRAAERGDDGVCIEEPGFTPFVTGQRPPQQGPNEADKAFAQRLHLFERTKDHAYFREERGREMPFLFQQSW
jgi:hypothetical protein